MNLTMQQPMSYPFYMGSPRLPFSVPWSPNPYHFPPPSQQYFPQTLPPMHYPLPFILSHQQQHNPSPKTSHSFSSYTNTRYNHLKQSTSHINRHRSIDTSLHSQRYSIPNYQYRPPLKTKSVSDFQQLSHQNSTHLLKAHSWHSMNHLHQPNFNPKETPLIYENHPHLPKKKKKPHRSHSSSSLSKQIPEHGIVRISTLDEMPIINNPIYKEKNPSNLHNNEKTNRMNLNNQSSASSTSSHSSFQKRLNGSLRNDPLLNAAMEDFQQFQRASSQSTSLTPRHRDLSRDSLCSDSTHRSSLSLSRSHSQSSFTSLERLEIRHLIKTLKTKGIQSLNNPIQLSPISPPLFEQILPKQSSSIPIIKPKKSSITEELDREFNKLRSINPNEDLLLVKPSLIHKEKKSFPPLPTFDELLHKISDTSTLKQIDEKTYENPIKPSSEYLINEKMNSETKSEYAIPIKNLSQVHLRSTKKPEQIRSFSFCKPINDIVSETNQTRPSSMFNWCHYGLTNPYPRTFKLNHSDHEYDKSIVKENIYASDIDVHIPISNETDYLSDYKQSSINNSSIFNDFSRLFTRKNERKSKLKTKLHKNNHHNNLRCSIM